MNNSQSNDPTSVMSIEDWYLSTDLSAEQIQEFQAAFSLMDIESKGYVCSEDVLRVAQAADMPFDENEAKLIVGAADEDHSGGIDMREFISFMTTHINPHDLEEELQQTFHVFDKDGNGTINASELKRFVRLWDGEITEDEANDMISQADPNKTGSINYHDFVEFLLHK